MRNPLAIGDRVRTPTWSDAWMSGARYGVVEQVVHWSALGTVTVRLDATGKRVVFPIDDVYAV